jgi:uncharacterized protein (UPF0335 family)
MIARDQIKSVIDRILRLKEEQDALGDDIREIYAEAKSSGYDKTALGRVVNHLRQRAKKGDAAMDEADTIFDLYLSAYNGPSHAHAREGEAHQEIPAAALAGGSRADGNTGGRHVDDPRSTQGTGGAGEGLKAAPRDPAPSRIANDDDDMAIPGFLRRTA